MICAEKFKFLKTVKFLKICKFCLLITNYSNHIVRYMPQKIPLFLQRECSHQTCSLEREEKSWWVIEDLQCLFKEISKDLEATRASSSWASTDRDGNYWWMWNIRGWRDNWNGRACRSIRNEVYYVKIMKIYCLLNKEIKGRISRRKKKFKIVRPQIFTLTVSVKFYLICLISFEKVWHWKKKRILFKRNKCCTKNIWKVSKQWWKVSGTFFSTNFTHSCLLLSEYA